MHPEICWQFVTPWPCLSSSDWSGWAQAIAATLAIAIAIYVPWKQRKNELKAQTEAKALKRRLIAGALSHPVDDMRSTAATILEGLNHANRAAELASLTQDTYALHTEFEQFRPELFLLGELGWEVNRLIGKAQTMILLIRALVTTPEPQWDQAFTDRAKRDLQSLIELANKCHAELKTLSGT